MAQFKEFFPGLNWYEVGLVGLQAARVWGESKPETIGDVIKAAGWKGVEIVYRVRVYTCPGGRDYTNLTDSTMTSRMDPTYLDWWVAFATSEEAEAWVSTHAEELRLCKEAAREDPGVGTN